MQEVFCGVPTGKLVANEFKGSTKKKVFMYLLRPGGKTYVKVSNNQFRYSRNSLRIRNKFVTNSLHITLCKPLKIFP